MRATLCPLLSNSRARWRDRSAKGYGLVVVIARPRSLEFGMHRTPGTSGTFGGHQRRDSFRHALARLLLLVVAVACSDPTRTTGPTDQATTLAATDHAPTLTALTCAVSMPALTVTCAAPDVATSSESPNVIIGGQGQYVRLTSSNAQVIADTLAVDVTVTNLIPQTIGTVNGTSAAPAGVRVFFSAGPTAVSGTMTVINPDGTGTFTASGQPYFQYAGLLAQDATSASKRWKFRGTPGVTSFTFTVYVAADVQYPTGYIDDTPYVLALNPGETRALTGTARTFLGTAIPGQAITWMTSAPGTAAVSGTQVTAGNARGFATLTPTAGTRPGIHTTAVSVCQSTVVTNGSNLVSSIAASDCFSSFGDPNGLPTTSYYADIYRVTLTAGQTITVTMDSGDDLDTYLLLANGSVGTLLAGNDDDDTGVLGVGSRLTYTATAPGVYVIEASTFNGLDTGNYTLHVTIN